MPWFSIKNDSDVYYEYAKCEQTIVFQYLEKGIWNIRCQPYQPTKFHFKSLLTFFCELQSALNNGQQLNEAIHHLSDSSSSPILAKNCLIIQQQLNLGSPLNLTLARLCDSQCQAYCQLLSTDGSREDSEKSLASSIMQLTALLNWSKKLLKGLTYPFFIIQIAILIHLSHGIYTAQNKLESSLSLLLLYASVSAIQVYIVVNLNNGRASSGFERINANFRLVKLLTLLSSSRETGKTLQQALLSMRLHFRHKGFIDEIIGAYYGLKLGQDYSTSLPSYWFPKASGLALQAASKNGDIDRALSLALQEHAQGCEKVIFWCEKIIPACCLFIAAGFVASALLSIYQPLLALS